MGISEKRDTGSKAVLFLRVAMLAVVALLIAVPVALMDRDPEAVSDIDNRRLAPITDPEGYYADRIGFRSQMITGYQVAHDRLFGMMMHPAYEYGKDGYVFFWYDDSPLNRAFIESFADYIASMQRYCEDRGIDFLYVISPEKSRIYGDYLPDTVRGLPCSVDVLVPMLEERGVNYIDQGVALSQARRDGAQVFNVVYDAGHWNTEGMYAGARAVIDRLQEMGIDVDDIDISDYQRLSEEQTELANSHYPISETTYRYEIREDCPHAAVYDPDYNNGLVLDDIYRTAWHFTSEQDSECTVLMFQGSYYNTQGTMLQNQFSEFATVHDYQNVFNLPYYVGVYRPDVVIFENADYTITDSYYSASSLESVVLPSRLDGYGDFEVVGGQDTIDFSYDPAVSIASFFFEWPDADDSVDFAYVVLDGRIYDCSVQSDGTFLWGAPVEDIGSVQRAVVVGVDVEGCTLHAISASVGPGSVG